MAKRRGAQIQMSEGIKAQLNSLYQNMGLARKEAIESAKEIVAAGAYAIQNEINSTLEDHIDTGETITHAIVPKVEVVDISSGGKAQLKVYADAGVTYTENLQDKRHGEGGWAAVLLDYGTPKQRQQNNPRRKYKRPATKPVRPRVITAAIRRGRKRSEQAMEKKWAEISRKYFGGSNG